MNLKLGLSSYAFYWAIKGNGNTTLDLSVLCNLLDKISGMGLEVFQICENFPLHEWDRNELKRIEGTAKRNGICLELGTRGLELENLQRHLEICKIINAKILRIVPWSGSEVQKILPTEKLYQVIEPLLPTCWKEDISLAIENYFDIPDIQLASFLEEINDERVGVCLDTANSTGFLENPGQTVELLAKYAVSLHLKDFVITKPVMGYRISGVPLGQGWLNAPEILNKVIQAGRCPHALIELWVDPEDTAEATIHKEDVWINQSVVYARRELGIGLKDQ